MNENETISAFAFKTGKLIEDMIHEQVGDIKDNNEHLQGKILQWYSQTRDEKFAEHFGIKTLSSIAAFDINNWCVKVNNRESRFSDFIWWINEVDREFCESIMFKAVDYISRNSSTFYAHQFVILKEYTIDELMENIDKVKNLTKLMPFNCHGKDYGIQRHAHKHTGDVSLSGINPHKHYYQNPAEFESNMLLLSMRDYFLQKESDFMQNRKGIIEIKLNSNDYARLGREMAKFMGDNNYLNGVSEIKLDHNLVKVTLSPIAQSPLFELIDLDGYFAVDKP